MFLGGLTYSWRKNQVELLLISTAHLRRKTTEAISACLDVYRVGSASLLPSLITVGFGSSYSGHCLLFITAFFAACVILVKCSLFSGVRLRFVSAPSPAVQLHPALLYTSPIFQYTTADEEENNRRWNLPRSISICK